VFSTADTIVAIATPPGRGGLGVVRLSGPEAQAIVRQLVRREAPFEARHATLSTFGSHAGSPVDRVIVTCFPAPASYTGDDVVEVSAHGSPVVLKAIVQSAMDCGARLAEPGEFTLRAFLNGRIDLMQAEAVADLIDAVTPLQARAAFDQLNGTLTGKIAAIDAALFDFIARLEASVDFPEEGYHFVEPEELIAAIDAIIEQTSALLRDAHRGRMVREGLQVAIVGAPNVGKSSLFNALVGASRAIVDETAGTTRDLVSETVDIHGLRVTLVDTAGLRPTEDRVEREGVSRAALAARVADLLIVVRDRSRPLEMSDAPVPEDLRGGHTRRRSQFRRAQERGWIVCVKRSSRRSTSSSAPIVRKSRTCGTSRWSSARMTRSGVREPPRRQAGDRCPRNSSSPFCRMRGRLSRK
jgi:tRNA modification GTPase